MGIYVVRAEFSKWARQFLQGGYVAIGWLKGTDLSGGVSEDRLYDLYRADHPDETSNNVIGTQVGQIGRFFGMQAGDFVLTPSEDNKWFHYGKVAPDPSYFYAPNAKDGCPFPHRRKVAWSNERLRRTSLSVPLQNTLRSSLTVFRVSQEDEFLAAIKAESGTTPKKPDPKIDHDAQRVVLDQLLQLDAKEFELLITSLLSALGFEAEHTGKPNDKGVDAFGVLDVSGLARINIYVQVKRWALNRSVSAEEVRNLRRSIPNGSQGAVVTTADFQKEARDVAEENGFARIGLINGHQLVDLLSEHWDDIPEDFRGKIGLRRGLVRA